MALGPDGFVYIAGSTRSVGFPTTPGAYQEEFIGEINGCGDPFQGFYNCDDAFLSKLGTDGTGLVFSTYLGGTSVDQCGDLAVDSQGRAYLVGHTSSDDFPPDGISPSGVIFVSRFDPTGSALDYSFFVDSSSPNAGHGIALDGEGGVYFTGALNAPADIYAAKLFVPGVSVSISSSMQQVRRDSYFRFHVTMTNETAEMQNSDAWTAATRLASGATAEPLVGPVNISFQPAESKSYNDVPQYIPYIPLGTYRYFLRAAESFSGPLWSEDFVDIEVLP